MIVALAGSTSDKGNDCLPINILAIIVALTQCLEIRLQFTSKVATRNIIVKQFNGYSEMGISMKTILKKILYDAVWAIIPRLYIQTID
jgi:hypothetical protein